MLALLHRKTNLSRHHPPIGLKVTQNEDGSFIQFEPFDLAQAAELERALPLPNRIRNLLEDGEPRSKKQIADELGVKESVIQTTLSKHKGTKWSMIGENRDARWTVLSR